MTLLLDTHVLLWAQAGGERLSPATRDRLADGSTRVLVSAVSAWEITIKTALGKLRAPDDLREQVAAMQAEELPITLPHALAVGQLPPHHTDPFDRLLVAQARTERVALVTGDARIARYDVRVLPA